MKFSTKLSSSDSPSPGKRSLIANASSTSVGLIVAPAVSPAAVSSPIDTAKTPKSAKSANRRLQLCIALMLCVYIISLARRCHDYLDHQRCYYELLSMSLGRVVLSFLFFLSCFDFPLVYHSQRVYSKEGPAFDSIPRRWCLVSPNWQARTSTIGLSVTLLQKDRDFHCLHW